MVPFHIKQSANQITIDFGQNFTKMQFIDDQGFADTSLKYNFSTALNVGYEYSFEKGLFIGAKIGYRPGGASYVFDDANYAWNLNYTEVRLGVGYAYDLGPVTARLSVEGYSAYLYRAKQQLHNLERDMLAAGSFRKWDHGLFITPSISYPIADNLDLGLGFNYMMGLHNIETDDGQETKNTLMGSNITLRIKL